MLRLSLNPSKQLLWFWLFWEMRLSKDRLTGVDAGCGFMQNKPMFRTKEYIGVDIDQTRLETGMASYPDAQAIQSRIEDINDLSGDFVLCVQVLHNKFFDADSTMTAIGRLIDTVSDGGVLVFNIGKKNMVYESEIDALLRSSFAKVIKKRYGSFASKTSFFAPILAALMLVIPPLRAIGGAKKILYSCRMRLGAPERCHLRHDTASATALGKGTPK